MPTAKHSTIYLELCFDLEVHFLDLDKIILTFFFTVFLRGLTFDERSECHISLREVLSVTLCPNHPS